MDTRLEEQENKIGPDLVILRGSDRSAPAFEIDGADADELQSQTCFSQCVALLETEWNSRTDPLQSASSSVKSLFSDDDKEVRKTCQRISKYVAEVEYRQHLRFCFLVFVYRTTARFLIFDRDEGIKSDSFDYVENPRLLLTFFYRLAMADDEGRGRDPTVTTPQAGSVAKLRESLKVLDSAVPPFCKTIRDQIRDCLDPDIGLQDSNWQLKEMLLFDDLSASTSDPGSNTVPEFRFLVAKPQTPAPSLFGRATKGYIAFDIATGRFVFLKDSWRSENQTPEYQTHKGLQDASVPYIATLLHGGDLRSELNGEKQKTRTSVVLVKRPRIHTRLVSKEIGEPLSKARKSKDLTAGLGKAVIGNRLSCFAFFR